MKTEKLICGIDISKATLDTCHIQKNKFKKAKFKNDEEGHNALLKTVGANYTFVMENTGVYGLKLCYALKKAGADVRVENPLVVKRYIQMNMGRNKSDLKDAQWICEYGIEREAKKWIAPTKINTFCVQILSSIDFSIKQQTMFTNYMKSMSAYPYISGEIKRTRDKNIAQIKSDIEKLEARLDKYIVAKYGTLQENLLSIPGIGRRTVAYLIVLTDGFKRFDNYRQVIAFAGLAPREFSSGTMELKKKICKMGNGNLRKTLYMGSLTAIKANKSCKELYTRLKSKGKNGKLALIAVCNKLLKQAFAIAKSGRPYDAEFVSRHPIDKNVG